MRTSKKMVMSEDWVLSGGGSWKRGGSGWRAAGITFIHHTYIWGLQRLQVKCESPGRNQRVGRLWRGVHGMSTIKLCNLKMDL